ncbi:MAG: Gfo/Idh/MocA family oxidoreductase [Armatimonadetes bacterium]|nr:Gfo/Idh/MocA family oxidoreductase [Armatimonadota bacterium]
MSDKRNDLTRRSFLRTSLVGMAAAGVPAWFATEAKAAEAEMVFKRPRKIGPNDTINLGLIGCGGRGVSVALWLHGKEGAQVVAVTDPDDERATRNASPRFGEQCKKYSHYSELIADPAVDAVIVGTPDHWHAKNSIEAMMAGKDVYSEKPMTLTIDEGERVATAERMSGRIFQTGTQQRSDGRFRLAVDLIRNGRIGNVKSVQTRLGTGPIGGPFEPKPVPDFLDWNLWLGPAPWVDYCEERAHYKFRWWHEHSGGKLTDWGAHHNDIVQWALDRDGDGPATVRATGVSQPTVGMFSYSAFPEFSIDFEYPDGVTLNCTDAGENGIRFEGDEGWLFVSRGKIEASDQKIIDDPLPESAPRVYVSNDHAQNFLDCVRTRKETICPAHVGHSSVTVCHLANLSLKLGGRQLQWDSLLQRFRGDAQANSMVKRDWRDY